MITDDAPAEELLSVAMCVHELFGRLPVTARSRNKPGVRIEDGSVMSTDYTGPVLEEVLEKNITIRGRPKSGQYKGVPVVVSPVLVDGKAVAAIGVVDTTGSLEIKALMDQYASVRRQVENP